jgi:uncharacterized protein (TIGR02145 family)
MKQVKYLIKFWNRAVVVICVLLLLVWGCKKEDDNNVLKDSDGNIYESVQIGSQIWMAENLKTTKFRNETAIPLVIDGVAWAALSSPAYCWYNNDPGTNKATYGAIYNWYTVNTRQLCPTGWHVPSDAEWIILTDYLGGISVAGGKLKETGATHWENPNTGATNESGFTALPGGFRNTSGSFSSVGLYFIVWSSTAYDYHNAYYRNISFDSNNFLRLSIPKQAGFSVRCIKDNL